MERQEKKLIFINDVSEISRLAIEVESIVEDWKLPTKFQFNLNLVLEELVSNIIFYAFKDKKKHEFNINFEKIGNKLIIELVDEGIAFDPIQKSAEEEIKKSLEERKIGGLGIHFVKKIMDEVKYKRENNQNILTLTKIID